MNKILSSSSYSPSGQFDRRKFPPTPLATMADVLFQLSAALRSKTGKEKMTSSESELVDNCKAKTINRVIIGTVVSSTVVSRATMRLGHWVSACLSAASAFFVGKMVFNRSVNACLEHILSIEGSRMQRELADIILRNYWGNPSRMQLVQKHFYPEVVFTDLKPEKPLIWWRARNAYVDGTASERDEEHSGGNGDEDIETQSFGESPSNLDCVNTFQHNLVGDLLADPLDCILGHEEQIEDIHYDGPMELTRRRKHAHKRGRRHRGAHHSEASSPSTEDKPHALQKLRI